jgi:hypothetical protein
LALLSPTRPRETIIGSLLHSFFFSCVVCSYARFFDFFEDKVCIQAAGSYKNGFDVREFFKRKHLLPSFFYPSLSS